MMKRTLTDNSRSVLHGKPTLPLSVQEIKGYAAIKSRHKSASELTSQRVASKRRGVT